MGCRSGARLDRPGPHSGQHVEISVTGRARTATIVTILGGGFQRGFNSKRGKE